MKTIFRSKRSKIITMLAIAFLCIGWYTLKQKHSVSPVEREAVFVETAKVKQGSIAIEAHAVGTLVAAKNVQLTSEVAGRVSKILVQDGSFVKEGAPLVQLDDAVNKSKAESAKANLTYSIENYNRMVLLGKKGAISKQAIEKSFAELKEKKAIAKESEVIAEKMLITAPFDGVIGKIKPSLGEYVTTGSPIVSLTDKRNLRIEFNISDKYLAFIKQGQQVTLTTTAFAHKEFYGKVAYIAPTINTEDRTISLYADVPNQDGLLTAGLFMNVKHLLGQDNDVLLIPSTALVATIDGQQVFKVVNNKAVAMPIKIGQRTMDHVQIAEGLKVGETVIVTGQHKVKDGATVKVKG